MKKYLGKQITHAQDTSKPQIPLVQQIQMNWSCSSAKLLPADLRPRERAANRKPLDYRAKYRKRLHPDKWSKAFSSALLKLSHVTAEDSETAFRMLFCQVKGRQEQASHSEWYAREALTSDIRSVLQELKRLESARNFKRTGGSERIDRTKAWAETQAGESTCPSCGTRRYLVVGKQLAGED